MEINFFPLDSWHWVILGLVLFGIELLFSGAYFLWIGAAALSVAAFSYGIMIDSTLQVLLFAILSVGLIWLSRSLMPWYNREMPQNFLNQRGAQLVGRLIVLDEPICQGKAQVQIADSKWTVHGPDMAAGQTVVVIRVEGVILIVEPFK